MTTFHDREHAIEAHYALLELAMFNDQSHRRKELGVKLAKRLGMTPAEAESFAKNLAALYVLKTNDDRMYTHLSAQLAERGIHLSPHHIAHMEPGDTVATLTEQAASESRQSFGEFVMAQLLLLFTTNQSGINLPAEIDPHKTDESFLPS